MSTPQREDGPAVPRDAGNWAAKVDRLAAPEAVAGVGYNVTGRRVSGPQQGFGRLWQRTYSIDLGGAVDAAALINDWKLHFGDYWPAGSVFHSSLTGIEPGHVAPIQVGLASHGPKLSTGIVVIYADEESFTFMTPEGHMFAGMITFSAEQRAGGTHVEIRMLIRPNDPMWELAWPVARRKEGVFWIGTLTNLAARYGVADVEVVEETICLDRKLLWSNWRNIWQNLALRTVLHLLGTPIRKVRDRRTAKRARTDRQRE